MLTRAGPDAEEYVLSELEKTHKNDWLSNIPLISAERFGALLILFDILWFIHIAALFFPWSIVKIGLPFVVFFSVVGFGAFLILSRARYDSWYFAERMVVALVGFVVLWALEIGIALILFSGTLNLAIWTTILLVTIYLAVLSLPIYYIEIDKGEVFLWNKFYKQNFDIEIRGRPVPEVDEKFLDLFQELDIQFRAYEYLESGLSGRIEDRLREQYAAVLKQKTITPELLNYFRFHRGSYETQYGPESEDGPIEPKLIDWFIVEANRLRTPPVLWVSPLDTVKELWNKHETIRIAFTLDDVRSSDKRKFGLNVQFIALANPPHIESQRFLNNIARNPGPQIIRDVLQGVLMDKPKRNRIE